MGGPRRPSSANTHHTTLHHTTPAQVIPAIDSDTESGDGKGKKVKRSFLNPKILPGRQPLPTRGKDGFYKFADHPEFRPNLSPKEVRGLACSPASL